MAFVWEQRKFVEFVKNAAKKNKDNIDLEPYAVTNDRGFIAQKDAHDDFGYMSNVDRTAYNIVPPNSFAYNPARINVGSLGYYEGTENVIVSSLYEVFQTEEYIDDKFLLHWFKSDSFPRWIEKLQEGSVRLYFYFDKLVQCQMMVPSLEEQKRISAYLDSIDQLITLHQRKRMLRRCFFSIDWEQRKLGDLVERITKKNQDLLSELPLTISAQYGLIDQKEFFDKRVASKDISGYYLIKNGEFAYNKSTSTDAPWGAIKRLDRYETGVLSTLYIVFGIKKDTELNSNFLTAYYSTNLWHKEIHEIAAEGARNHGLLNISPADFFKTKLSTPQDLKEQNKIGNYFIQLDQLITLHQCKSNFCKKNEVNAWEQRKLGDITESYSGGTPTAGKKEYYDGNIPFIRSGEISSDKTELFISEEGLNRSSAKMVKIGDILYALYGATSGEVSISKLKGAINQAILAIQPHQNYDSQFLMQWLRKSKENIIGTYLQGGQGNLSGNIVKELIIDIPTYEEQKEIGAYLKKLDHLITLHQWECNINENTEGNDEKQRKPIKKLIISEGNLSLVDDMFLLHRMTFLVCNKYILLRLNVVKYKITIIIISNILYSIVSLLIIACYLIVINKQLIILIYVEISVVIIKGDDDYARIRS
ncbi:restriction endonuclease subunit S [[Clostridium] innocuum]|uniref:restriction endonuclease subunit S n=1 Tax=Clostridium innocuum TaxID=1522 RepID=UPI001D122129|nr:restriction endonuclease subunit S [[Clostridium] innocuum]MCC2786505.1 restriction endonuclease subunit S [[Clostridium] innocuum]MCC2795495.1 restriction endonuclease subunit S [[Clostridium] innocuum]MCC2827587.1 restriction endonuclease subunit S [[Clostridium] innocuum]MCG4495993.1 restriction endonuclease subunit S [[Clostridium] innocuum]